jgi:preprotein translocase subunit SecG
VITIFLTILHVLVCVFLIIVVLLQSGKAADLAGAFGGMGSQTAFGPRGSATLLSQVTTISAIIFMLTSMSLSIFATRNAGVASTVLDRKTTKQQTAPKSPMNLNPTKGNTTTVPLTVPPAPAKQPPAAPKK